MLKTAMSQIPFCSETVIWNWLWKNQILVANRIHIGSSPSFVYDAWHLELGNGFPEHEYLWGKCLIASETLGSCPLVAQLPSAFGHIPGCKCEMGTPRTPLIVCGRWLEVAVIQELPLLLESLEKKNFQSCGYPECFLEGGSDNQLHDMVVVCHKNQISLQLLFKEGAGTGAMTGVRGHCVKAQTQDPICNTPFLQAVNDSGCLALSVWGNNFGTLSSCPTLTP